MDGRGIRGSEQSTRLSGTRRLWCGVGLEPVPETLEELDIAE